MKRVFFSSVAIAAAVLLAAASANADVSTIGSLGLPAGGTAQVCTFGCTVMQGQVAPASAGSYVLRAPSDGTITSWSYRSANAGPGSSYALRLLRPTDSSETAFTAVTTTASQTVPYATDSVQGPFPVSIPVKAGDRIGLEATGPNDPGVPIFTTGQNDPATGDGVRWFQSLADGASDTPMSPGNNGQQVLVQATVQTAPPPPQLFSLGITRHEFRGVPNVRGQSPRNRQITTPAKIVNSLGYKKRKYGTLVRYWISEAATVTFTVEKFAGCGRQPRVHLCSFKQYGQPFSVSGPVSGHAGHNGVGWLGRVFRVFHLVIARKALPLEPGSYRLYAVASNANGQSNSKYVDFTIIP